MIPYVLLIFIPLIFSYVAIIKHGRKHCLMIGSNRLIRENNLAIPFFFLLFLLLLMLRDETIGRDLSVYKIYFNSYRKENLRDLFTFQTEFLYKIYNWLVGQITANYQLFLASTALVTVVPIAKIYFEDRKHGYLKIILFVNLSTFIMIFSGLRQAIAMAIGMIAYSFVREKKLVPFIISVLIAIAFHHSAFILFAMYPLYYASFRKKHLLIVIPAMVVIFVFNQQIFAFMIKMLALYSEEYSDMKITFTGAYGSLALFVLYIIFSYVVPDENFMNRETIGLRNFMILIVCIQFFVPLHTIAMRMNYYYLMFIPILIGKVLNIPQLRYQQIARIAEIVLMVFFTFTFLYSTFISTITGISALDTVPYKPFWR